MGYREFIPCVASGVPDDERIPFVCSGSHNITEIIAGFFKEPALSATPGSNDVNNAITHAPVIDVIMA